MKISRAKKRGRPFGFGRPVAERLRDGLRIDPETGCHNWTRSFQPNGYARISIIGPPRRHEYIHRVAYELAKGPIPAGLHIDHLCRNTLCCNPDHLEPVTPAENVARSSGIPAINSAKTHCLRGHPFDAENTHTVLSKSGRPWRKCRACHNAKTASYRERVRAAGRNA